ncbi:MAG: Jag N-terminal domain-containing protein [Acidobacteria bacterium]|nr:Jag N-terminal domain-containing protein [Acidobacteriota bacterium]
MEWVETTGRTIDEAKNAALEMLGVDVDDAEFEILEEPKPGLFGRTRGEARVRARVRPTQVRPKTERRDRRRGGRSEGNRSEGSRNEGGRERSGSKGPRTGGQGGERKPRQERAPRAPREEREPREERPKGDPVDPAVVGAQAVSFLEGVTNAFGLSAKVVLVREDEEMEVQVNGDDLGLLVGPKGNTLLALQDLTRVVAQRRLGDHDTRLRVDVAGYRERRRDALSRFAMKVASDVMETGKPRVLEPMASADRKVVHDTLAEVAGVSTRSRGEDPYRQIVVEPAAD